MPRYFFHIHSGDSRANPDHRGLDLPDADAAQQMAERIAHRLLKWNLEPVPWLDYQVHVTDEAGAVVCELPLTEIAHQPTREAAQTEAAMASPKAQLQAEPAGPAKQHLAPEVAGLGEHAGLDAVLASLAVELQEVTQAQALLKGPLEQPRPTGSLHRYLGRRLWKRHTASPAAGLSDAKPTKE
jgi:hypothetical protein